MWFPLAWAKRYFTWIRTFQVIFPRHEICFFRSIFLFFPFESIKFLKIVYVKLVHRMMWMYQYKSRRFEFIEILWKLSKLIACKNVLSVEWYSWIANWLTSQIRTNKTWNEIQTNPLFNCINCEYVVHLYLYIHACW